eukprot:8720111-Karenia_brevis.AAC.1
MLPEVGGSRNSPDGGVRTAINDAVSIQVVRLAPVVGISAEIKPHRRRLVPFEWGGHIRALTALVRTMGDVCSTLWFVNIPRAATC